jgi:hypothetical protein
VQTIERVAQEVRVTALPGRLRQDLAARLLEAGVVVADDELDAGEAALLEPRKKLTPARSALPFGELDRQLRMRRARGPPRAEAQSRCKSLNPPNRDAAPRASRQWANRRVLAERLSAGVLALGINCANQVGIHFQRHRLSKSPRPPLRVAPVRSPMRLRSRNCRKDSRCLRFRAAAVRQIEAFAPHCYPGERA